MPGLERMYNRGWEGGMLLCVGKSLDGENEVLHGEKQKWEIL
jgi:hypothetical protein